jgi:hypothetical protein
LDAGLAATDLPLGLNGSNPLLDVPADASPHDNALARTKAIAFLERMQITLPNPQYNKMAFCLFLHGGQEQMGSHSHE